MFEFPEVQLPLRFLVQMPLLGADGCPCYRGFIASGRIGVGDEVLALPARTRAYISSVVRPDSSDTEASAPLSVTVTLDRPLVLGRGDMLADPAHPPAASRSFRADVVWMNQTPLVAEKPYLVRHMTRQVCAMVSRVEKTIACRQLAHPEADSIRWNGIGTVCLETQRPLYSDPYAANPTTGTFTFTDPSTNCTAGVGMIRRLLTVSEKGEAPTWHGSAGLTVWFTGLSGAGKTTIARAVHDELRARDFRAQVLDGDVLRRQISKDLGFSKEDRDENIRRLAFFARLLNRNGVIVLVAAISPYRAVRDEIRQSAGNFLEVYVNAPIEVCEQRDAKGHYRSARTGQLSHFTGITDPYEPPLTPEIECRTDRESVSQSVAAVLTAIDRRRHLLASDS